jgi:hypothetical protein
LGARFQSNLTPNLFTGDFTGKTLTRSSKDGQIKSTTPNYLCPQLGPLDLAIHLTESDLVIAVSGPCGLGLMQAQLIRPRIFVIK